MHDKVVLVTGATGGIGRVASEAFSREGADLFIVARDRTRGEATAAAIRASTGGKVTLLVGDLGKIDEVRRIAAEFREQRDRLHVLVNNAGALNMRRTMTSDGLETTFAVNHVAYYLLTRELVPVLMASWPSRVVVVSSDAHRGAKLDFDDLQHQRGWFNGIRAYNDSKLANLLFTIAMARRLEGTGVTVNAVHPGPVATGFALNNPFVGLVWRLLKPFLRTPEQGARGLIFLATSPTVADITGAYWMDEAQHPSSEAARDLDLAEELWAATGRLTGTSL